MNKSIEILLKCRPIFAFIIKAELIIGIVATLMYFSLINQNKDHYHAGLLIDILSKYRTIIAFIIELGVAIGIVAAFIYFRAKCQNKEYIDP